ncbi:MAG: ATP-dependent zinc metalloprotease FtsH, partial [Chlamydiae bacterium]|nr:ATP-dependent zinc metalloprotease FtsH [Chlamydiota bacterium]
SYSHQVEHLVNLDLIQKDKSSKIGLNDNLVSFSGQFKEQLSEDSAIRYRYLELLNDHHKLTQDKIHLLGQLASVKQSVTDAADYFLQITGLSIPSNGFSVVSSRYNTVEFDSAVKVKQVQTIDFKSLKDLKNQFPIIKGTKDLHQLNEFGEELLVLQRAFKSPNLGVGSDAIKSKLMDIESDLEGALASTDLGSKIQVYQNSLNELDKIVVGLNTESLGARLQALRSTRAYLEDLKNLEIVSKNLETNEAQLNKSRSQVADVIWFFNNKEVTTKALERQDPEAYEQWFAQAQIEWNSFNQNKELAFKAPDQPRTQALDKTFKSEIPSPNYMTYFIFTILPIVSVVLLLYFVFSRQMKSGGSSAMNFGKSPAKMLLKSLNPITFKDVAGVEEAKEELQEIVDFLKDPSKFTALGARIPRGVLCVGPPGTGKTLIAKAVAGEADRPFFYISGSDFVEMFVGVGASRIRDLFDQAKKQAPCIIFIDEIDAVGRHRGAGIGGGHDEREQTLNQLLVEMDGMNSNEGIILMAATNRPDVLDKALLRPGRFDRRIILDLPDVNGRMAILKVHARKIKLDALADLHLIAKLTPGSSGADLMNMLNEAALMAARKNQKAVSQENLVNACDKVRFGKERRSMQLDAKEKRTTAYHESGHAVVSLLLKHSDPVEKVTIIPRGMSLGATHFVPKSNRVSYWRKELLDQLATLMGGRVAEEVFVGDICSGAQMDIAQATRLARAMVCEWGMNEVLGLVAYDERGEAGRYLGQASTERNYSEETSKLIDIEVKKMINEAYALAKNLVLENKDKLELMTEMLLEFETLDQEDVKDIMAGTFTKEGKKERMAKQEEALRRTPPPAPKSESFDSAHVSPQQI